MCGVAGFYDPLGLNDQEAGPILTQMTSALSHRGPNSAGHSIDSTSGIALGHTRLAIMELSTSGAQPMQSHSKRYHLVFNGEIYNHLDLRRELRLHRPEPYFRGNSDTETILACFDQWGLEDTVRRAIGMFAFALWDRQERVLHLGRDRFGEKPLYYGWQRREARSVLLFGSELKALHAHPRLRETHK